MFPPDPPRLIEAPPLSLRESRASSGVLLLNAVIVGKAEWEIGLAVRLQQRYIILRQCPPGPATIPNQDSDIMW
jgi:hypothetical protein